MKNISNKSITFSIILLFIGVSFSSGISADTETTDGGDCGCNEVSDTDLIRVERLLNRVEVYSKFVLVLSRYNPELKEDYEELSNMISTMKTLDLKNLICDWLYNFLEYLGDIEKNIRNEIWELKESGSGGLQLILLCVKWVPLVTAVTLLANMWIYLDCGSP